MNTQDEMAGNSLSGPTWSGFDQFQLSDDSSAVNVTIGSSDRWDKAHLRRLRQSADLPGLVPVIDSDFASDGKPFAVTPVVDSGTLGDRIPPSGSEWLDCAAVTEAAARASHEAHLRGLFHGALSPDQIHIIDDDVAVSGIGLGLGGTPSEAYSDWVAPEVLDGNDATERSDVYSLGKILEASLGNSIEDVPRSVRRLIMWSSSDTPEARPPSALEFASILAEAMGEDRKTYSPAFIATAESNDLASTASESVAAFEPSERSFPTAAAAGAGAAVAGAAALGAAALGDDDDAEELSDAVDTADVAAGEVLGDDDVPSDAVVTGDLPAEDLEVDDGGFSIEESATATTDLADVDVDADADADVDAPAEETVFDSKQYGEELEEQVLEADDDYDVPAAAQTVDLDLAFEPERKGNRAGILVGAILAAGLGVVAYGILSSNDDSTDTANGDTATSIEEGSDETDPNAVTETPDEEEEAAAPSTSEEEPATTTITEAATTTSEATTTTEAQTTTTEATTTTTEAPTEESEPAPPAATVEGPISAEDAGVQVLHGIPGVDVDVYVNGEALAPGFTAGTIAGPADLDPGSYDIDIYAASDSAPAAAADRTDDPILSETMTVGAEPATLVAHLDAEGNPVLSAFEEDFETLQPGTGRVQLRHLAAAPAVAASVDGVSAGGLVESGGSATVTLDAGEHTIETTTADGTAVKSATIDLADGEVASISIIGSAADDSLAVVVQRYTGLSTAPAGVPTGNSNLLADGEDPTALYLLGILTSIMALGGGLVMVRRSRQVL